MLQRLLFTVAALTLLSAPLLTAQTRDFRTQRIVLDDNGSAPGGMNTVTVQVPILGQNVVLTLPDPGTATASLVLNNGTGSSTSWLLGGNSNVTGPADYIGTQNAQALHLFVNGGVDNSLILNTNGSVQRDNAGDARGTNAVDLQIDRAAATEVASGTNASIGGGRSNTASHLSTTVGGGTSNTASGSNATVGGGTSNTASQANATVGGGNRNTASQLSTTVGGGSANTASRANATVGGGARNTASGSNATVGGGSDNNTAGDQSAIPGGKGLTLTAAADGSFGFLGGNTGANDMTIAEPNIAVFGNTDLWLANNDGAASQIRFYEANSTTGAFPPATTFYTSFEAGNQTVNLNYTLPIAAPTAGQVLQSDASGTLSWATAGSGGAAFNRVRIDSADSPYAPSAVSCVIGVDVSTAAIIINLPDADQYSDGEILIINVETGDAGTNSVTINAAAGDTFDSGPAATPLVISFAQGQFRMYSDGANGWYTY